MDEIHQLVKNRITKVYDLNQQIDTILKPDKTLLNTPENQQQPQQQNTNQQKQIQINEIISNQSKFQEELRKAKEEEKFRTEKENWILNILKQLKDYTFEQKQILYERSYDIMILIYPNFSQKKTINIYEISDNFQQKFCDLYQQFFAPFEKQYEFKSNLRYVTRSNNPTLVPDMLKYLVEFSRDFFKKFTLYQSQLQHTLRSQKAKFQQKKEELNNNNNFNSNQINRPSKSSLISSENSAQQQQNNQEKASQKPLQPKEIKCSEIIPKSKNFQNQMETPNPISSLAEQLQKAPQNTTTNTNNINNNQQTPINNNAKKLQKSSTAIIEQQQPEKQPIRKPQNSLNNNPSPMCKQQNFQSNLQQNSSQNQQNSQQNQNEWYSTLQIKWFKKFERSSQEQASYKGSLYNNLFPDLDSIYFQLQDFKIKRCRKYPDEMKINMNTMLDHFKQRNNNIKNQSTNKYFNNFQEKFGENVKQLKLDKQGQITLVRQPITQNKTQNFKKHRKNLFNYHYSTFDLKQEKIQKIIEKQIKKETNQPNNHQSQPQSQQQQQQQQQSQQQKSFIISQPKNQQIKRKENSLHNSNTNNNNNQKEDKPLQQSTYIPQQQSQQNYSQFLKKPLNDNNLLTKTKIIKLTIQGCESPFLLPKEPQQVPPEIKEEKQQEKPEKDTGISEPTTRTPEKSSEEKSEDLISKNSRIERSLSNMSCSTKNNNNQKPNKLLEKKNTKPSFIETNSSSSNNNNNNNINNMKVNLIKKNSQKHRKSLREKQFLNNTEPSEQNLDADLQPDHSQAKNQTETSHKNLGSIRFKKPVKAALSSDLYNIQTERELETQQSKQLKFHSDLNTSNISNNNSKQDQSFTRIRKKSNLNPDQKEFQECQNYLEKHRQIKQDQWLDDELKTLLLQQLNSKNSSQNPEKSSNCSPQKQQFSQLNYNQIQQQQGQHYKKQSLQQKYQKQLRQKEPLQIIYNKVKRKQHQIPMNSINQYNKQQQEQIQQQKSQQGNNMSSSSYRGATNNSQQNNPFYQQSNLHNTANNNNTSTNNNIDNIDTNTNINTNPNTHMSCSSTSSNNQKFQHQQSKILGNKINTQNILNTSTYNPQSQKVSQQQQLQQQQQLDNVQMQQQNQSQLWKQSLMSIQQKSNNKKKLEPIQQPQQQQNQQGQKRYTHNPHNLSNNIINNNIKNNYKSVSQQFSNIYKI